MSDVHLTAAEIDAHARRELDSAQALVASDHLEKCAECRARLTAARSEQTLSPVTYEELADWVDDKLDPLACREVAQKLSQSSAARTELRDLETFKTEMLRASTARRGSFARWVLPLAAAAVIAGGGLWWATQSNSREQEYAIEVPELVRSLRAKPSILAGEAAKEASFHLLAPVATAVEDGAPIFQWSAYPSATSYRIVVALAESDEVLLTQEVPTGQQSWKPNDSLGREKTYRWEVEALRGDQVLAKAPNPPEPDARFRVISQRAADELAQLRVRSGGAHAEMGIAYARAGLITKAEEEFAALQKENPKSPLPEKLRAALAAALRARDS